MEFVMENWYLIIAAIAVIAAIVVFIVKMIKGDLSKQLDKVREWLLYATSIAEKELGSGTGQLKLRQVYDMFVIRFPWLSRVISFTHFSMLVDEALESLNKLLDTNIAVQEYVVGSEKETEINAFK